MKQAGARATKSHREGNVAGSNASSFGPTSRDVNRAISVHRRDALADQVMGTLDGTIVLAGNNSTANVHAEAMKAAMAVQQQGVGTFAQALATGNMVVRVHRRAFAQRLVNMEAVVSKWHTENGPRLLEAFLDGCPTMMHISSSIAVVTPKCDIQIYDYRPPVNDISSVVSALF